MWPQVLHVAPWLLISFCASGQYAFLPPRRALFSWRSTTKSYKSMKLRQTWCTLGNVQWCLRMVSRSLDVNSATQIIGRVVWQPGAEPLKIDKSRKSGEDCKEWSKKFVQHMNSMNQLESCRINLIRLLIRLQALEAAPVASLSNCAMLPSSGWEAGGTFPHLLPGTPCSNNNTNAIPIEVTEWSRLLPMSLNDNNTLDYNSEWHQPQQSSGSWNGTLCNTKNRPAPPSVHAILQRCIDILHGCTLLVHWLSKHINIKSMSYITS